MDEDNRELRLSLLAAAASAFEEQPSRSIMSSKQSLVAPESRQDPQLSDTNALTPPAGMVRFPCRSRNSSPDHNSMTAYFCIPIPTAMHGIELICSHPKCQLEGVKFRFCTYCRIPAAKRNFSKRHMHGIPQAVTAVPYRKRTSTCIMQQEPDLNEGYLGKGGVKSIRQISSSIRDLSTFATQSIYLQEGGMFTQTSTCEGSSSLEKGVKMPPDSMHASQNDRDDSAKVPQTWIDLYHSRPNKVLIENGKLKKVQSSPSTATERWLQRVLAEVDSNIQVEESLEQNLRI